MNILRFCIIWLFIYQYHQKATIAVSYAQCNQNIINSSNIDNIENLISITGSNVDRGHVIQQTNFSLHCQVPRDFISDMRNFKLQWYHENKEMINKQGRWRQSRISASPNKSNNLVELILTISNVSIAYDCGEYKCLANNKYNSVSIEVVADSNYSYVQIKEETNTTEIKVNQGELVHMVIEYSGYPSPIKIIWISPGNFNIKNDDPGYNIESDDKYSILTIRSAKLKHNGNYTVVAKNSKHSTNYTFSLIVNDVIEGGSGQGFPSIWIFIILGISIFMIFLMAILGIKIRRDILSRRKLRETGIVNFINGDLEHINHALSVDEQAELLPYDERFEFSRQKLHLGKQLGIGAFGVVYKATAENILPNEKKTLVAVKMVKKTADSEVIRALLSELKIMVHLGQHLNVLNLLGAVTKNINNRELMIIVEFCRFGNIQNFLYKNRERFINQINPGNDSIDQHITTETIKVGRTKSVERTLNRSNQNSMLSASLASSSNTYFNANEIFSNATQIDENHSSLSLVTSETFQSDFSNDSEQPIWRSNYKSDSVETMEITTSHLISWAFQVARGMDYLASRNVLHGDLAARNILLCEDNIVKICDFGLARSMYNNDNYKKNKDAKVPVKWLALESLGDRVFSTRSDVWSFGIVLWEIFSLGKVPYPGMDGNQNLYDKLKSGYRMEKPQFANKIIYEVILQCWNEDPESRPLFEELKNFFVKIIGDHSNKFIDLDNYYLRLNSEVRKSRHRDYLSSVNQLDDILLPSPNLRNNLKLNYLNEPKPSRLSGYLEMKAIFPNSVYKQDDVTTENSYFLKVKSKDNFNTNEDNSDNTNLISLTNYKEKDGQSDNIMKTTILTTFKKK